MNYYPDIQIGGLILNFMKRFGGKKKILISQFSGRRLEFHEPSGYNMYYVSGRTMDIKFPSPLSSNSINSSNVKW